MCHEGRYKATTCPTCNHIAHSVQKKTRADKNCGIIKEDCTIVRQTSRERAQHISEPYLVGVLWDFGTPIYSGVFSLDGGGG
jgi:hypothetical protein